MQMIHWANDDDKEDDGNDKDDIYKSAPSQKCNDGFISTLC